MAARVRKYGWENRFGNPFKSLDQVIDDYGIIVDEYCLYLEKSSRKIIKATEMLEKGETQSADEVEEVQSLVALALAGEDGKQRKRTAH
jgi:hypothetical protein